MRDIHRVIQGRGPCTGLYSHSERKAGRGDEDGWPLDGGRVVALRRLEGDCQPGCSRRETARKHRGTTHRTAQDERRTGRTTRPGGRGGVEDDGSERRGGASRTADGELDDVFGEAGAAARARGCAAARRQAMTSLCARPSRTTASWRRRLSLSLPLGVPHVPVSLVSSSCPARLSSLLISSGGAVRPLCLLPAPSSPHPTRSRGTAHRGKAGYQLGQCVKCRPLRGRSLAPRKQRTTRIRRRPLRRFTRRPRLSTVVPRDGQEAQEASAQAPCRGARHLRGTISQKGVSTGGRGALVW